MRKHKILRDASSKKPRGLLKLQGLSVEFIYVEKERWGGLVGNGDFRSFVGLHSVSPQKITNGFSHQNAFRLPGLERQGVEVFVQRLGEEDRRPRQVLRPVEVDLRVVIRISTFLFHAIPSFLKFM